MPRDLDATILAAMNAGNFTPYFNLQLIDLNRVDAMFETTEVMGFELDGLTCKVSFHDPDYYDDFYTFRIQRGVVIDGTPYVVTSSNYWPIHDRHEKRIRTLEGHVFPNEYYSTPGDVTYGQIIDDVCTHFQLSVAYDDPAAAWLSYQFLPTGRVLVLNDAKYFFTFIRQKYLIFATDFDEDMLYFYQAKNTGPAFPAGYVAVSAGHVEQPGHGAYKQKSLISRDEAYSTHTSGGANSPIHNLGFLPSTASHPTRSWFIDTQNWIIQGISPNLKYLDFDAISAAMDVVNVAIWPAKFREVFNKELSPSWQWQARFLDVFGNTEGGALPSTIEAVAPYTPLNVSNFDNNLDYTVNNLQALAEAVDELDIGKLTYKGAWSSSTHYEIYDVVDSGGISYVCILSHTNHVPPNATYWQLAPAQGAEGPAGPAGEQGVQGESGDPGAITEDAPDDGDIYGRKNEAWIIVTASLVGSYTTGEADASFAAIDHDHSGVYSPVGHDHSGVYEPADAAIQSHLASSSNPHSVTASQVGAYTTGEANAAFAAIDHDHSGVYSAVGHDHSGVYEPVISYPLVSTRGGTGKNNAGSLTNASNTTITGGGTIALGGFTLTVPATGTIALLSRANVFTTQQLVDGSSDQIQFRVQGHSTQTSDLQRWETSASGILARITGAGYLGIGINPTVALHVLGQSYVDSTVLSDVVLVGNTQNIVNTGIGRTTGIYGRAYSSNVNGTVDIITGNWYAAFARNQSDVNNMIAGIVRAGMFENGIILTGAANLTITNSYVVRIGVPLLTKTGAGTLSIGTSYGILISDQGNIYTTTTYGLNIASQTGSGTLYSLVTNGGNVIFNEGGDALTDFRVESDNYDALFVDASNNSIVLMSNSAGKVGFFGASAVVQATELTDELTTITCSAPGAPDYAIQDLVANGYGFVTADEGQSTLNVIANLQTRVNELETKFVAYGLLVDAD